MPFEIIAGEHTTSWLDPGESRRLNAAVATHGTQRPPFPMVLPDGTRRLCSGLPMSLMLRSPYVPYAPSPLSPFPFRARESGRTKGGRVRDRDVDVGHFSTFFSSKCAESHSGSNCTVQAAHKYYEFERLVSENVAKPADPRASTHTSNTISPLFLPSSKHVTLDWHGRSIAATLT